MVFLKTKIFLYAAIITSLSGPGVFPAKARQLESLYLYMGIQYDHVLSDSLKGKTLKFEGTYKRFTSLKYHRATGNIRFAPRRVGVGALIIKGSNGRILKKMTLRVRRTDLRETANEIQSLLRTIDGINIKILNNRVVVDGEILIPKDMVRIHDVIKEYKGRATSFVTLNPVARIKLAKFIEKEIKTSLEITNVSVRVANTTFILEGMVDSLTKKNKAQEIATIYLPGELVDTAVSEGKLQAYKKLPILNNIQVKKQTAQKKQTKLIKLTVQYVELNKNYTDSFRFQWLPQIDDGTQFTFQAGGGSLGQAMGIISGTINNFLPKLNWAKSFGFARILHSANVVTEDKQQASISSGETIPYQASQSNGDFTIAKADVSILAKITPEIISQAARSIRLKNIRFEIRNLVGSTGGAPITSHRILNTSLHVANAQTAVIGGLISNNFNSDYNREPRQRSQRPLVSFLSSKKFTRSQSQFVVFVTPLIQLQSSSGVDIIKKRFRMYQR